MATKFVSMTNVFSEPVRISIGGSPGEGVTVFVIAPGESQEFDERLCLPVPGAGPEPLPSIIDRQSTRTWPDGTRKPTLVARTSLVAKAAAKTASSGQRAAQ